MSLFDHNSHRTGTEVSAFIGEDSTVTMSSREIAELCEKRHDNVIRDIKGMLAELGEPSLRFEGSYSAADGTTRPCFNLPKDLTITLVAGYNVILRKRIIDRWMELEAQSAKPFDPNDPSQLRGILLSYTEKVESLEKRVDQLLPSETALNRIANADGSLCVTDAAKALQIRPKDLFEYLRGNGWIYRRAGSSHDVGYQSRVIDGTLEHKVTTVLRPDGSERVTEQVRITPKGLTKLAKLIPGAVREA